MVSPSLAAIDASIGGGRCASAAGSLEKRAEAERYQHELQPLVRLQAGD
jgi:hypothetical protein